MSLVHTVVLCQTHVCQTITVGYMVLYVRTYTYHKAIATAVSSGVSTARHKPQERAADRPPSRLATMWIGSVSAV